jgi:hypothetical protein
MDYFLIEAVNTLRASAAVATARAKKVEQEMIDAGLIPAPAPVLHPLTTMRESASGSLSGERDSARSSGSKRGSASAKSDEDEEAVRTRLEAIGLHVGANFAERYIHIRQTILLITRRNSLDYAETSHYSQIH